MRVLVTGANGYIGQRLILSLLSQGHKVLCLVRSKERLDVDKFTRYDPSLYIPAGVRSNQENIKADNIEVIEGDLLRPETLDLPKDIDIAYYLVHSMSQQNRKNFEDMESECTLNFVAALNQTNTKQVIYLSGISNDSNLSKHLSSRRNVEDILGVGNFHLTVLRAAIIIGSGSASFEIIRDLVEKLPVMIAPKWLNQRCQPIAIRNVIQYLTGVIDKVESYDRVFDIGGPDILSYKEMLLAYAHVRKLKRLIITLPLMTARLSSYWLHFITSTNYALARTLVSSLRNEVLVQNKGIEEIVALDLLSYEESIRKTLYRIGRDEILSSWRDACNLRESCPLKEFSDVPTFGCKFDLREIDFNRDVAIVKDNIWKIGGEQGYYYLDWLWQIRGTLDKLIGGVGLSRGRREEADLRRGDVVDFWRVQLADYEAGHLILFAEMKVPGEAWLEFKITQNDDGSHKLTQKATFRPHGLFGRFYWYILVPVHHLLFEGMARKIISS